MNVYHTNIYYELGSEKHKSIFKRLHKNTDSIIHFKENTIVAPIP